MRTFDIRSRRLLLMMGVVVAGVMAAQTGIAQSAGQLTPIQREIERQRQRLSSSDIEERRDALMRLGNLKRPDASRVAAAGLNDLDVQVRVAAAHAIVFLPPAEAAGLLLPLLQDRAEFIRREAAYALGETHSRSAVARLTELLSSDKEVAVRGAAAVALGQIGDETAVNALLQALSGTKKKKAGPGAELVMSSAAHSIGQSLRAVLDSSDPYLAEAAREALRRLATARN